MPYDLRDQPEPIERVILHLGADLRGIRLMRFSQSTWSMIENGLAEGVRLELLARIAVSLHLDVVLRPCTHPVETGLYPPNGRIRRTEGATRIPGTRRLEPGPHWNDR